MSVLRAVILLLAVLCIVLMILLLCVWSLVLGPCFVRSKGGDSFVGSSLYSFNDIPIMCVEFGVGPCFVRSKAVILLLCLFLFCCFSH